MMIIHACMRESASCSLICVHVNHINIIHIRMIVSSFPIKKLAIILVGDIIINLIPYGMHSSIAHEQIRAAASRLCHTYNLLH